MIKKCLFFLFMAFLVAAFAAPAKAVTSGVPFTGSYATLDWSKFKWYGISLVPGQPDPTISWIYQGEGIWAENQDSSYDDSANNWTDDLVGVVSTPPSEAGAATKSDVIKSYGEVYTSGYAESFAYRLGEFRVSGSGLIVFSIPYTISGEIDAASALEEAYLESYIGLVVANIDLTDLVEEDFNTNIEDLELDMTPFRGAVSGVALYKDYDYGDVGTWTEDGVISVALYFNDGEIGTLVAGTYTYADQNAPIPSSIIILTSGIGIIFIRRRYVYE